MQVSIYSNGSQECERAASLLKAVHLDEVVVYEKASTLLRVSSETSLVMRWSIP